MSCFDHILIYSLGLASSFGLFSLELVFIFDLLEFDVMFSLFGEELIYLLPHIFKLYLKAFDFTLFERSFDPDLISLLLENVQFIASLLFFIVGAA